MPCERIYFIFSYALPLFMPTGYVRRGISQALHHLMATTRIGTGLQAVTTSAPATQDQE